MTNVDYCEKFKEDAYNVNVIGTKNLAKIAQQIGSKFIHISSDAVFSGEKNCYVEDDKPNPVNIYGTTKLESEKIASKVSNCLILRPSVIYGWIPSEYIQTRDNSIKSMNFALWILKKLNEKQELSIVNDQFNTPTLADNLAENIIEMTKKDMQGIFHTSGLSCINRLDFSKKIAKVFGYSYDLITSCSSSELKQIATRPLKSCLNCKKIVKNGIKLLQIDEAIGIMFNQVKKEQPELVGKA
jgi:dTDP-4-dehydrorhamnose reductase